MDYTKFQGRGGQALSLRLLAQRFLGRTIQAGRHSARYTLHLRHHNAGAVSLIDRIRGHVAQCAPLPCPRCPCNALRASCGRFICRSTRRVHAYMQMVEHFVRH